MQLKKTKQHTPTIFIFALLCYLVSFYTIAFNFTQESVADTVKTSSAYDLCLLDVIKTAKKSTTLAQIEKKMSR